MNCAGSNRPKLRRYTACPGRFRARQTALPTNAEHVRTGSMRACSPFADIQVLIAAALAEERGALIPIHRQAIDELLDQEREHAKSESAERARSLELSVAGARGRRERAGSWH